jgi:putative endonuclease
MSKHNETGVKGEQIAAKFLTGKGYTILHRNWCFGKKEVDLVVQKDDTLVFVEVKTRTSFTFGFPEEAVNTRKQTYLKNAAEAFVDSFPGFLKIQFDIVSIRLHKEEVSEIVHFEDAFY